MNKKKSAPRLPGSAEERWSVLLRWLERIERHPSTQHDFLVWAWNESPGAKSVGFVDRCLDSMRTLGLIAISNPHVTLTPPARAILETKQRAKLLEHTVRTTAGFQEILSLDPRHEYTTQDVWEHLKNCGYAWKTATQVNNRLEWLVACGVVERVRRGVWRFVNVWA